MFNKYSLLGNCFWKISWDFRKKNLSHQGKNISEQSNIDLQLKTKARDIARNFTLVGNNGQLILASWDGHTLDYGSLWNYVFCFW